LLNRIKCAIGKHAYYEIKKYSISTRKVGCRHCEKTWAMNDDIRAFVPWGKEFDDMYDLINKTIGDEAE
jgi:hypothetical protein